MTDWRDHLTPQEAVRLDEIDRQRKDLKAEARRIFDRARKRGARVAEIVAWMRGNCMSGKWRVLASEIEEKWGKP